MPLPFPSYPAMGRGVPALSGLKNILPIIKQESASLETDDHWPQASAILMRIAATTRDPQQDTRFGAFSHRWRD